MYLRDSRHKIIKLSIQYNIVVFAILLFCNSFLFSQNNSNFIHLSPTIDNQSISVDAIAEDISGSILLKDNNGLYKYDGYDYTFIPFIDFFGNNFSKKQNVLFKKDTKGNIWLASQKGELVLVKTDGSNILFHDLERITSIKPNEDDVYFGSINGTLYRYNFNSFKVERIAKLPKYRGLNQEITSLVLTSKHKLWISTQNGSVFSYNFNESKFKELELPFVRSEVDIIRLVSDKEGKLWIATELNGVFRYSLNENSFKQFDQPLSLKRHSMFIALFCDASGYIWAGTDGDGLFRFDPVKEETLVFRNSTINKYSISNNTIVSINDDSHGNLWFVDKKGIVNILPFSNNNFNYYSGSSSNSATPVLSMIKSVDGSIWIGTDGQGINHVLPNGKSIQYSDYQKGKRYFEGRYILNLLEDKNKNIWIATYQNGLYIYDYKYKKINKVNLKAKNTSSPLDIRTLFKDSDDRIWIASTSGIYVYADNQKLLAFFKYNSKGLKGTISESFIETKDGTIWLGVNGGGLFSFVEDRKDLQKSSFKNIKYFKSQENPHDNNNILFMDTDIYDNLWIRTVSGSLLLYKTKNDTFQSFAEKDFIKDIEIVTVLVDSLNTLWLGSNNGLHNYNPETEQLKSYYQIDGIQGNDFSRRGAYKAIDGMLFFGGDNGLTSFYPNQIVKEESSAKLFISQIEVLNKPLKTIIPEQLNGRVENIEQLELKYNQSSFSFKFSAVENVLAPNYYYAYRLKGFNDEWITSKKERTATYTNIPSGEYDFEVKAGSKKGIWDIPTKQIKIIIEQPLWNRPWAYLIYFIISSLLVYGIILWIKLKNKLTAEELKHNQDKELYALKMNFFAKMSHEIQTPLTLISGPIDNMLDRAVDSGNTLLNRRLKMISNNVKRLSKIVFELTSFRNKELGRLTLRVTKNDLVEDVKEIVLSFEDYADFKKINYTSKYSSPNLIMWYDKNKFEYIFYNLLSNAFKFTPKGGSVKLEVEVLNSEEQVKITVIDSGPGIPENELENIFKLFYQSGIGKKNIGSGIGLALTKEIIDLHHGIVDVTSSPEKGTYFCVTIPTGEDVFLETEKNSELEVAENYNISSNEMLSTDLSKKISIGNPEKRLLIVEDNYEMQIFLKDIFDNLYEIFLADNGEEGFSLAKEHNPDLIISDIMMPRKDGLEMSKLLQKDKMTSHIPIILLTAKKTKESKLKGLQTGAIEYINKPFNANELLLTVYNIIKRSDRIIDKYKNEQISSPKKVVAKSQDEEFLEKTVTYIDSQLANPDFKVEHLTNALNMSYSSIYRKFTSLTGKKLVDYVRNIRIKKATILFIKYEYSISEAAFSVGFNDPKYFSKCFKKEFGKTPVEFKEYAQEKGVDLIIEQYNLEKNINH